jgi:hypothetical protein
MPGFPLAKRLDANRQGVSLLLTWLEKRQLLNDPKNSQVDNYTLPCPLIQTFPATSEQFADPLVTTRCSAGLIPCSDQ